MNKKVEAPIDRVIAEMNRLKLNNQDMAARLGITKFTWNNWKTRGIPASEHSSVAERLGWTLEKLVSGKEQKAELGYVALDVKVLAQVIAFIEEILATYDREWPPEIKAEAISVFYDDAIRRGGVDRRSVESMLSVMIKSAGM
jgi:hypothetical protein